MAERDGLVPSPVDVDEPRWNQQSFRGRFNHFVRVTNPLLVLTPRSELYRARELVLQARSGFVPSGTTRQQVWKAKVLYDSAFHPDTGEKMATLGSMCAQVPAGMVIIGGLLAYRTTLTQLIVGQWVNQSFNALVNYTNRNAKSKVTNKQIAAAYVSATGGAVAVSVMLNRLAKKAPPIVGRWVPFVAVAAANFINIPMMRQRELIEGMIVTDDNGNALGQSRVAAVKGISQVFISRLLLVSPSMLLVPVLMQRLEKMPFFKRGLLFSAVLQTLMTGTMFLVTVPAACALFPQKCSLHASRLERSVQAKIRSDNGGTLPDYVYFNKGL